MKTFSSSWPLRAAAELERRRRHREKTPEAAPELPSEPVAPFAPRSLPQQQFHDSTADITILGGSVFGGKTWALTHWPTRHASVPGFSCVTFRRVVPEIRNPGGLWDESMDMYPFFAGKPRENVLEWDFPSGAGIKFAGLQLDKDVLSWKSSQICRLQFDQLEEFTEHQFWYMLSRNRSQCGVRPSVGASCNPDPDSFLATFLSWWIDQTTGYAIPERSGQCRWFIREGDTLVWADTKEQLVEQHPRAETDALSAMFILARLQDNEVGNRKDPSYLPKMRAMPYVEQERLLGGDRGGNWKIRASAGLVFNRAWFTRFVDRVPEGARRVRAWDNAATPGGGDWTGSVKIAKKGTTYYIEDASHFQKGPDERETAKRQAAESDGVRTVIRLEQEPGSSGVDSIQASVKRLHGFTVRWKTSTGDKVVRSGPLSSQVQAGNVVLVRGDWNETYLRLLDAFPTKGIPDDLVDASNAAFDEVERMPDFNPDEWADHRR